MRGARAWLSAAMLLAGVAPAAFAGPTDDHEHAHAEGRPTGQASRPVSAGPARPPVAMTSRPAYDGRGQPLDQRYNHGRYYPPPGFVIAVLPPYYSTRWFGGVAYYYADNVYYTWQPDQNGYAVMDPPDDADQPAPPPAETAPQQPGADDPIVYPKNAQTKDQQAADQYECHGWATGQTGFDPTQPDGGMQSSDVDRSRSNYYRAMSACLQGRGYQVN